MEQSDKVIQAHYIARMSKRLANIEFILNNANGNFIQFNGTNILEFETLRAASNACVQLNSSVSTILDSIKTDFDTRMKDILSA